MKDYIASRYGLFLLCLAIWFLFALNFRPETVIAGVLLCGVLTELSYQVFYGGKDTRYSAFHIHRFFRYVSILLVEVFKAALRFAVNLFKRTYKPVVFTIELDVESAVDVAIVANSITLTPGTITIDSDTKKKTVTVLTIAPPDATPEELAAPIRKRFERLLQKKRKKGAGKDA